MPGRENLFVNRIPSVFLRHAFYASVSANINRGGVCLPVRLETIKNIPYMDRGMVESMAGEYEYEQCLLMQFYCHAYVDRVTWRCRASFFAVGTYHRFDED
jgi:hypothetical protein